MSVIKIKYVFLDQACPTKDLLLARAFPKEDIEPSSFGHFSAQFSRHHIINKT
ncbi:hypothetical protein [Parasulfitobacter algicola]|uniref:Uncharacterized protein n=1 Tax=Parasulfitobacter algicola TaxID=2614809 RepID=A0ABX2IZ20_9RHOB|nr:hypothetical protein [Sulfitobacter algicola]NSX56590.1 hypothetical protein [Sulfitobacter algicola]